MAEVVFCHSLFAKLREEAIDLHELAMMVSGAGNNTGHNPTNDSKVQASQDLAGKVV